MIQQPQSGDARHLLHQKALTGEVLGISAAMYPFILSGYVVLAALLLIYWQRTARCRSSTTHAVEGSDKLRH